MPRCHYLLCFCLQILSDCFGRACHGACLLGSLCACWILSEEWATLSLAAVVTFCRH